MCAGSTQILLILHKGLEHRGFWHWGPGTHPRRCWVQGAAVSRLYLKPASQDSTQWKARLLLFYFHELLSAYLIHSDVVRKGIRHYFSDDVSHCSHYENRANHASSFKEYSFRNDFFLFLLKWWFSNRDAERRALRYL